MAHDIDGAPRLQSRGVFSETIPMNVASSAQSGNLAAALDLAAQGLPVFPVYWMAAPGVCACKEGPACDPKARGKHPITPRGHNDATTDVVKIADWWRIAPHANVGIAVPDGLAVVDVDPRNGGEATFDALDVQHPFGPTRFARTGGGGAHFWYRLPSGYALPSTLGDGVDIKQKGGYVLAPPSNHASGGVYAWGTPSTAPIADAAPWLRAMAYERGERTLIVVDEDERVADGGTLDGIVAAVAPYFAEGKKHHIAKSLGGWLKQRGYGLADVVYVVERLPTKNPKARVKAAMAAYSIEKPFGWNELKGLIGDGPAASLDAATPNPRRARELEERASAADMAQALVAGAQTLPVLALRAGANTPANGHGEATLLATAAGASLPDADQESKSGGKQLTMADVVDLLAGGVWADVLGYDSLAGRVMCLREPPMRAIDAPGTPCTGEWTDAHTARARTWISSVRSGREPSRDSTDAAVEIVARRRAYHPVQNYLASLRWDGVPRLDGLLARFFGSDFTDYTRQVGAKTLIAAVARATRPGAKVDTMTILEGAQGIGKSRAVRALVPLESWFADTPLDLESKDAAQCLQGKWIYEIGELHSFNRSETTRIKAFVSSQADNLRPSYGRRNQDFPRQCIFIGTTNGTEYLSDTTGNRRYWPVRCRAIDVVGLQRDRDQLWAEAATRYTQGERWWLEGAEVALAEAQQADREAVDPWEAELAAWLEPQQAPGLPRAAHRAPFTMTEVLAGALRLGINERTQATATRVGKLLARLGWKSKAAKDPTTHKVVRVYMRAAA